MVSSSERVDCEEVESRLGNAEISCACAGEETGDFFGVGSAMVKENLR